MTPILCTLFDFAYLPKGLAFIESLQRHQKAFKLYVAPLDMLSEIEVRSIKDGRVEVIPPQSLIRPEVVSALRDRNPAERAWTLTPILMKYLIEKMPNVPHLAYMDADSYLFYELEGLYGELEEESIAIIPHRFSKDYVWRTDYNGTYNVNFVWARNDLRGWECIADWERDCLRWCYQRTERTKDGQLLFGDQGYLDAWVGKYNAHVISHIGANVAPWNQLQYEFEVWKHNGMVWVAGGSHVGNYHPLLFYHFHGLELDNKTGLVNYGGYPLQEVVQDYVYKPYTEALRRYQRLVTA